MQEWRAKAKEMRPQESVYNPTLQDHGPGKRFNAGLYLCVCACVLLCNGRQPLHTMQRKLVMQS